MHIKFSCSTQSDLLSPVLLVSRDVCWRGYPEFLHNDDGERPQGQGLDGTVLREPTDPGSRQNEQMAEARALHGRNGVGRGRGEAQIVSGIEPLPALKLYVILFDAS